MLMNSLEATIKDPANTFYIYGRFNLAQLRSTTSPANEIVVLEEGHRVLT